MRRLVISAYATSLLANAGKSINAVTVDFEGLPVPKEPRAILSIPISLPGALPIPVPKNLRQLQ
jgi:hypothetical protein